MAARRRAIRWCSRWASDLACIVMAYIVMAFIVMACVAMAYIAMAYIVMACIPSVGRLTWHELALVEKARDEGAELGRHPINSDVAAYT